MLTPKAFSFPDLLVSHRRAARLSQLDLSLKAGISQRHLSFLETGRSKPGRTVATSLARALGLHPMAANTLLEAAGFADLFPQRQWSDAAMAPVRAAAGAILTAHMPFPAVLIDIAGDVLDANPAFDGVLGLFGNPDEVWNRTHAGQPRNLLRLSHHPAGPAAALVNFEAVARATLARALREGPHSPRLRKVLGEIAGYPNVDPAWLSPVWEPAPAPVIEERYRIEDKEFGVFAVVTSIGAPMDITAGSLRIESYFPLDSATRTLMEKLAAPV